MNNYHKIDSRILQFELESIEFKFGMWITKKEFGQRLNDTKPLPKGQFYMSVRVVAKDIEVTEKIARRLIKQFTKLEIIRLISTSKSPKQGSIYEYVVQVEEDTKKGTVEDTVKTQLGHSKNEETSDFKEGKGHSKDTVEGTIEGTSKNKNKIKENIYSENMANAIKRYPGKKIKSVRDRKLPKLIKQYGEEQIIRCIDRYLEECKSKDKQYILNESTFWNERYIDYLDENYLDKQEPTKTINREGLKMKFYDL